MAKDPNKPYANIISNNGNFGDYFWVSQNKESGHNKDQNSQADGSEKAWSIAGNAGEVNDPGAQNEQRIGEDKKGKGKRKDPKY